MEHFMNWRRWIKDSRSASLNVVCHQEQYIMWFRDGDLRYEAIVELEGVGNSIGDPCSAPLDVSYLNELFSERVHIKIGKIHE